ncbi:MAG: TonB family protein [Alphaproteobacteria bacterium]|nr:TonB family protein [Alphaproteobacteria bacterium]
MRGHLLLAALLAIVASPALADAGTDTSPSPDGAHSCADRYPVAALRAHAEGSTVMSFTIRKDGSVSDQKIARSSGNPDLDAAAMSCVPEWRYKPATKDGKPVDAPWQAAVQWKLRSPDAAWLVAGCTRLHPLDAALLAGIDGRTLLTFRVMPDSSVTDAAIVRGSGNAALDQAGIDCLNKEHYNIGALDIPPEGLAGHVELDWPRQLELDTPIAEPPPAELVPPKAVERSDCSAAYVSTTAAAPTVVALTVGNNGVPRDLTIKTSSGSAQLDRTALQCIAKYRYRPATLHDEPVAVRWTSMIQWKDSPL